MVQASAAMTSRPVRNVPASVSHLEIAGARVAQAGHRDPVAQRRAVRPGEPPVGGIPLERVGQPALSLPEGGDVRFEPPLRPAAHDLRGVQELERDALRGQALDVVRLRDGRIGRPQVEPAGDGDDPLAGCRFDLPPAVVGTPGEPDVVRAMVGEPDDPAVVGRRAIGVVELELLETEHPISERPAQPVGRGRADRPESDDDGIPVAAVGRHVSGAPDPCRSGGRGPRAGRRAPSARR